jgi:TonB family protein
MDIGEALPVTFAAVASPPTLRGSAPVIRVPEEAVEAGIEGSWTIYIDVDQSGQVSRAQIRESIGYGVDEACREAWMSSRWRPGLQNDAPIAVTGIPMRCTLRAID